MWDCVCNVIHHYICFVSLSHFDAIYTIQRLYTTEWTYEAFVVIDGYISVLYVLRWFFVFNFDWFIVLRTNANIKIVLIQTHSSIHIHVSHHKMVRNRCFVSLMNRAVEMEERGRIFNDSIWNQLKQLKSNGNVNNTAHESQIYSDITWICTMTKKNTTFGRLNTATSHIFTTPHFIALDTDMPVPNRTA